MPRPPTPGGRAGNGYIRPDCGEPEPRDPDKNNSGSFPGHRLIAPALMPHPHTWVKQALVQTPDKRPTPKNNNETLL